MGYSLSMRLLVPCLVLSASLSVAVLVGACGVDGAGSGSPDPDAAAGDETGSSGGGGEGGADGGGTQGDGATASDGTVPADAHADSEAGADGAAPPTPAVQLVGRFDTTDAAGPRTAWPGSRIIARFDGTEVSVKLTQTDGFSGGPTYFNVVVDGAVTNVIPVAGTQTVALANGLAAGTHTVELEKRTEAPFGTVRFEGFTFGGGAGLLAPPARLKRRIEFLGDSTIDGYGADGDRNVNCLNGSAPPQYNNVRKSIAWKTAAAVSAELHLVGYSAKGVARNEDGQTNGLFPTVYARTLPDVAGPWNFASYVPDAVVVTLGGSDYSGDGNGPPFGTFPGNFAAAYAQLVADIRANYGAAPYVFLTVWSQHKAYNGVRAAITSAVTSTVAGRPAGEKTYSFVFPESANPDTNETGCQYHANEAHHAAMSALLVTELKAKIAGW